MKCPYRKVTIDLKSMGLEGTEEGFAECYKEECPFYAKSIDNFNQREYGECLRALREI